MGTIRQKKVAALIAAGTEKNKGKILESCGYAKNTADQPAVVLESKGFLEEFNKLIPPEKRAAKHNQFLDSEREEIGLKALDMAYKISGDYAPEKRQVAQLNLNADLKNSEETKKLVEEYENKIANMLKASDKK